VYGTACKDRLVEAEPTVTVELAPAELVGGVTVDVPGCEGTSVRGGS
jgi:hypothetical protein